MFSRKFLNRKKTDQASNALPDSASAEAPAMSAKKPTAAKQRMIAIA